MPSVLKIDQAATFVALVLLSCEPKLRFGSQTDQECATDGTPKWEAQLIAAFNDGFGKAGHEVLKVGFTASGNPAKGVAPYTPVQLVDFEVGVMDKTRRMPDGSEKVLGAQIWYRASALRPVGSSGPTAKISE